LDKGRSGYRFKVINELEVLRQERNELRQELEILKRTGDTSLDEINDVFKLEYLVKEFVVGETNPAKLLSQRPINATVREIFEWLSESLYRETREDGIRYALKAYIQTLDQANDIKRGDNTDLDVTDDCIRRLRYRLEALGLVRVFTRYEQSSGATMTLYLCWSITDKATRISDRIENSEI
jgi:hypothetical protein